MTDSLASVKLLFARERVDFPRRGIKTDDALRAKAVNRLAELAANPVVGPEPDSGDPT